MGCGVSTSWYFLDVSISRGNNWTFMVANLASSIPWIFWVTPGSACIMFGLCNASVIQWLDTSCTSFLLASFGCIGTWAGLSSPMKFLPAPSFLPPAPYLSLRSCCVALRSQECCRKPVRCKKEDMGYLGDAPQPLLPKYKWDVPKDVKNRLIFTEGSLAPKKYSQIRGLVTGRVERASQITKKTRNVDHGNPAFAENITWSTVATCCNRCNYIVFVFCI